MRASCPHWKMPQDSKEREIFARRYITADRVSTCIKVKMWSKMKCLCAQSYFIEFKRAVEMWPIADAALLNMVGRHKELPGRTNPTHTAWPFPKRTVMLCRNGKKWMLSRPFIDCYEKTANLKTIKTRCFPFCLAFCLELKKGKTQNL